MNDCATNCASGDAFAEISYTFATEVTHSPIRSHFHQFIGILHDLQYRLAIEFDNKTIVVVIQPIMTIFKSPVFTFNIRSEAYSSLP